jgi:hypothetical protein
MEKSVIEKKFKKLASKDLEKKSKDSTLSKEEREIAKAILKSRETGEKYVSPSFKDDAKEFMKRKAEEQAGEKPEKSEKAVKSEKTPVSKPKKDKEPVKNNTKAEKTLTEEQKKKIQHIVLNFEGSKKELVVYLLEHGFTKQQLDKYTPQIAHWSYIYDIAKGMGK